DIGVEGVPIGVGERVFELDTVGFTGVGRPGERDRAVRGNGGRDAWRGQGRGGEELDASDLGFVGRAFGELDDDLARIVGVGHELPRYGAEFSAWCGKDIEV